MPEKFGRDKLPKIFSVNWFRKDKDNKFLWPGFGENSRVLKWIFERLEGKDTAWLSPIGLIPKTGTLDTTGLKVLPQQFAELFEVDQKKWAEDLEDMKRYLAQCGAVVPQLIQQIKEQELRLLQHGIDSNLNLKS